MNINANRVIFLSSLITIFFILKLIISLSIEGPFVFPDEAAYGNSTSIANFSIYSIIPYLFGYRISLIVNCLLTSLCSIPIFYLFRKYQSEKRSAILTVLVSLFAPLWFYSFVNMTEALLFLVTLWAALNWKASPLAILTKPLGITVALARFKEVGVALAILFGIFYLVLFGTNYNANPGNLFLVLIRSVSYIFLASLGFALFPVYRMLTNQADNDDKFAVWLLATTFAALLPIGIFLPYTHFFGRYFDAAILVSLTTAFKPTKRNHDFIILLFALFVISFIAFNILQVPKDMGVDSGLDSFIATIQNAISLSKR